MTLFDKFLRIRELGIFSIIIVFVIVAAIIDPRFMTLDSWRAVFLAIPLILVMAMGQMMVIICRHVDISIGSILAFSAIVIGLLYIQFPGLSLWLSLLITAVFFDQSQNYDFLRTALLCSFPVFLTGLLDDLKIDIKPSLRKGPDRRIEFCLKIADFYLDIFENLALC